MKGYAFYFFVDKPIFSAYFRCGVSSPAWMALQLLAFAEAFLRRLQVGLVKIEAHALRAQHLDFVVGLFLLLLDLFLLHLQVCELGLNLPLGQGRLGLAALGRGASRCVGVVASLVKILGCGHFGLKAGFCLSGALGIRAKFFFEDFGVFAGFLRFDSVFGHPRFVCPK